MAARLGKPLWIAPLIIAGVVAVFGGWANHRLRETVQSQLRSTLQSTLAANVAALEIWNTNQTRHATLLAEAPEVSGSAARILEQPTQDDYRTNIEQITAYLRPKLAPLGYRDAQLITTNFTVAAMITAGRPDRLPRRSGMPPGERSGMPPGEPERPGEMRPGWRGIAPRRAGEPIPESHTNQYAELFSTGRPILITPFRPEFRGMGDRFGGGPRGRGRMGGPPAWFQRTNQFQFQQPRLGDLTLMQVAAPIRGGDRTIGALALVINPTDEFTRILSVARTGDSGETYAFDQTGLLISQSRFDAQLHSLGLLSDTNESSALNLRLHDPGGDLTEGYRLAGTNRASLPLISIVSRAIAGADGVDVKPTRDYRGRPVVAAWQWLPELGFGVATQVDAQEAFRPLRVLQWIFILLFLLLVLCATGLFVFSYANITWRRRWNEAQLKLKQLGQYTLEEKIGEGGMGKVYRARHALLRRETAVKLLSPDTADAAAIARFEREVQLTCQLTHPNTIQVFDYGHTPEGVFYYAMEYLGGLNLHDLVGRYGVQPEARVVHILLQVCDSLTEAHALGLVHRDIKPANVFLCERGGIPDCVKVLDFGLVRTQRAENFKSVRLTGSGEAAAVGTPLFMPPESFKRASDADARSDLYSVGALAYYVLTGTYVFTGENMMDIYEQQLTSEPAPPSSRTTNPISQELETVLLRCLQRDPSKRPQSASELRDLLLQTPFAHSWTLSERAAWWKQYHASAPVPAAETATPAQNTVKIDFASRLE